MAVSPGAPLPAGKGREVMDHECELLATCGFFRKFQSLQDMACRGFIKAYCHGPQMDECKRKQYRRQHGTAPPDDMLPTGQTMPKAYQ